MSIKHPEWIRKPGTGGRPAKYPWATLEIGESFRVPDEAGRCKYESFYQMAVKQSTKFGRKFHTRIDPVDNAFECYRSE